MAAVTELATAVGTRVAFGSRVAWIGSTTRRAPMHGPTATGHHGRHRVAYAPRRSLWVWPCPFPWRH